VEELKACPFCGGTAKIGPDEHYPEHHVVRCRKCGVYHFGSHLAERWQRRTAPPPTAAMVAWAKRRIAEIGELRRMDMVGFNEMDEMRMLEEFVGEWEA
jgi:hypothetical protein